MALYVCTKRHFAAGGELVAVGTEVEFKANPGSLWQQKDAEPQADERKLEVATPKKRAATKEQ